MDPSYRSTFPAKAKETLVPQTIRQYWLGLHGRVRLNFNWNIINHDSVVLVSAAEYSLNPGDPRHSARFVGAADVTVSNISPHSPPYDPNHGVTFIVNVAWPHPIDIVTDITVLDRLPEWTGVQ
jgi:hypothetical protein